MKSNSEARPSTVFLFLFDGLLTWQKIYEIVPVCFCPEMPYTGDVKRGKSEYVDGLLAGVATSMSSELFENWVLFQILPHSTWKEWIRILHICRHLIWKNILKVLIFPSLALIDSFLYHLSYIFAMWTSVRKVASAASSYHENVAAAQSQSNERPSSLVVYLSYFWDKNIGAVFMNVRNLLIFK